MSGLPLFFKAIYYGEYSLGGVYLCWLAVKYLNSLIIVSFVNLLIVKGFKAIGKTIWHYTGKRAWDKKGKERWKRSNYREWWRSFIYMPWRKIRHLFKHKIYQIDHYE